MPLLFVHLLLFTLLNGVVQLRLSLSTGLYLILELLVQLINLGGQLRDLGGGGRLLCACLVDLEVEVLRCNLGLFQLLLHLLVGVFELVNLFLLLSSLALELRVHL